MENGIEITCIYAFQSISVYGTFSITIRLMTNSAAKRSIGYGHQEQREGSTTSVKLSVANTLIFSVKPLRVLFFDVPSPIACVPLEEIFSFRLIFPLSRASRAWRRVVTILYKISIYGTKIDFNRDKWYLGFPIFADTTCNR